MHFEILVEDQSGKKALDVLVPKIIGNDHTFNVHPFRDASREYGTLLQLPRKIPGRAPGMRAGCSRRTSFQEIRGKFRRYRAGDCRVIREDFPSCYESRTISFLR